VASRIISGTLSSGAAPLHRRLSGVMTAAYGIALSGNHRRQLSAQSVIKVALMWPWPVWLAAFSVISGHVAYGIGEIFISEIIIENIIIVLFGVAVLCIVCVLLCNAMA